MRVRSLAMLTICAAALTALAWWALHIDVAAGPGPGSATGPVDQVLDDPALLAGHALRAAVIALSAWLGLATALAALAGLIGHDGLFRLALAMTPGVLRRAIRSAAATTLTAGLVAGGPFLANASASDGAPATGRDDGAATATLEMVVRSEPASRTVASAVLRLAGDGTLLTHREASSAVLRLAGDGTPLTHREASSATSHGEVPQAAAGTVEPGRSQEEGLQPPSAATDTAAAGRQDRRWSVRPGESFWSIAAEIMGAQLERPASDAEIVGYWEVLIDANAAQLVVPGEPDLLLVGQVLIVPSPTLSR